MTAVLQCKGRVHVPSMGPSHSSRRCSRKAVRDGFCTQHHPEAKWKRAAKQEERTEARLRRLHADVRARSLGYAVLVRMTAAERAALPEWLRAEFALDVPPTASPSPGDGGVADA